LKAKMLTFFLVLALASINVVQAEAEQTTVEVTPASYTVPDVGLLFVVNVTVKSVQNLSAWEAKLFYPNDVLNGTSVAQGPFLKAGGEQTFFWVGNFTDNYNATHGFVNFLCARMTTSGVNGSGTLATIAFKSMSTDGPRALHLAEVKLSYPDATQIPCVTVDGEITILPEFITDLILPLLAVLTLTAICLKRRRLARTELNVS
jgi:hypothetical protein